MNKLPIEVIVQIAFYLPMSNKLNLAFTCKKLFEVLKETTLYSTVLFKNMDQFNQAMEYCGRVDFG